MSSPSSSRRRFLACSLVAAASAPLAARYLISAAQAQDLPPVPGDNPTATALAYVEDAAKASHPNFKPGSNCANCQFYTGAAGAARGPCTLFPNYSVAAAGWCTAWAKKA